MLRSFLLLLFSIQAQAVSLCSFFITLSLAVILNLFLSLGKLSCSKNSRGTRPLYPTPSQMKENVKFFLQFSYENFE